MESERVKVWVTASQATDLEFLAGRHRAEEKAAVKKLVNSGWEVREARIEVARWRRERWPSLDRVVAAAVERRLAEGDLAGPWAPLSTAEREGLGLSGRWPGPAGDVRLVERAFTLDAGVVVRLRTASWRVSEGPLGELRRRGLVGRVLSVEEREARDVLARGLYPVGRIVREALARYGPGAG